MGMKATAAEYKWLFSLKPRLLAASIQSNTLEQRGNLYQL